MSEIVKLFFFGIFGAILPFIVLFFQSKMSIYYLLVSIFTNQVFLIFVFGRIPIGLNSGGGIFYNLTFLYLAFMPISCIFLILKDSSKPMHFSSFSLNRELLKWSWLIYCVLSFFSAFSAKYKLLPIFSIIAFSLTVIIMFSANLDFNLLSIAIYRVFAIISGVSLFGVISNSDWALIANSSAIYQTEQQYFSPLSYFFNIPVRSAGLLPDPQTLGLFCSFGFCNYLFAKKPKKSLISPVLLLIGGSLGASRTFYAAIVIITLYYLISNKLPKDMWSFLTITTSFIALTIFIMYKFILPLLISDRENLISFTGRRLLWSEVLLHWSDDGLFGHGANSLTTFMIQNVSFPFAHAHNTFLQALWDYGVVGFITALLMVVSLILEAIKLKERVHITAFIILLLIYQTEPTILPGITWTGWFWLVPLVAINFRRRGNNDDFAAVYSLH
jgi:O-antigen ligase